MERDPIGDYNKVDTGAEVLIRSDQIYLICCCMDSPGPVLPYLKKKNNKCECAVSTT